MAMPGDLASLEPAACANGSALLARCGGDSPSGAWRVAAASAGVAGVDAFLCHLSRSIAGALEHLAASAEAARAKISAARGAAAVEAQAHCDELESRVASTEASKRRALELELCAVDATLERLRAERGAASEAVASLSDTELEARSAEFTDRLDAVDAQLLALPTSVVEPPYMIVVVDEAALLAGAAVFGRVVAPLAITAADLSLEGATSYAYPGRTLMFRLVNKAALRASQSDDELEVSLGAAATATHIEATLKAEGAALQSLKAYFKVDALGHCVTISIGVPQDAPVGSSVVFSPLTVSGRPVAGLLGPLVVEPRVHACSSRCNHRPAPQGAVWAAADAGDAASLQAALSGGGSTEETDSSGDSALAQAAGKGHREAVDTLLRAGAKDGRTPLHWATSNGHAAVAQVLLGAGADKEAKDEYGRTPLLYAAAYGHTAVTQVLLEAGADKEANGEDGGTPLHVAGYNGHAAVAQVLLGAGADKEAKDEDGVTPLHRAAANGHTAVAQVLLGAGADKEANDELGFTPLHVAAYKCHTSVAQVLLGAGADKEARTEYGWTPLHAAAREGHAAVAQMLLGAGADKEAKIKDGSTPLNCAAQGGYTAVAQVLLGAGADKEAKTKDGWTPLHWAAFHGRTAVAHVLLEAGADKEAKTKSGDTPADLARQQGKADVLALLQRRA